MIMALLKGKTTAKRFVEEGAYVFINGRSQAELDAAVKEIGENVTGVQKRRRCAGAANGEPGRGRPAGHGDHRPVAGCALHRLRRRLVVRVDIRHLLREIFDIDVPVGVIVNPANDLQAIADCIEVERQGTKRPSFASVHGRDATEVHSSDLTLDKFIDAGRTGHTPGSGSDRRQFA
jgi:hypothetical protein